MISVIVPVYNVQTYLPQCLDSILSQTYQELEVILVNDGSTDSSGRICNIYAEKDPRIRVVHKANGGVVSARQKGVELASGEYIIFADSDDWVEKEMYQILYDTAVRENADIVVEGKIEDYNGECFFSFNQLSAGSYRTQEKRRELYEKMISCNSFFCLGIQPYLWNKLFSRKLIVEHIHKVPKTIRIGEDAAVTYPVLSRAECVVILDRAQYHYCHHQGSMMMLGDRNKEQEYNNAVILYNFLKQMFMEQGIYGDIKKQLLRYYINCLLTRCYDKFAGADAESVLFPFPDIKLGDTIIIYGAGALGQAVYQYAVSCTAVKVKAIMDQKASCYRKANINVDTLENIFIEDTDKILITVFSEIAYCEIRESLICSGINPTQLFWINTKKLEKYFIESGVGQNAG